MQENPILKYYQEDPRSIEIQNWLEQNEAGKIRLKGLSTSAAGMVCASVAQTYKNAHLFILPEKEQAAYFMNDLEQLLDEQDKELSQKRILFFPTAHSRPYEVEKVDNNNLLLRTEVLKRVSAGNKNMLIVTFPEALSEKVISRSYISKNTIKLKTGEEIGLDFLYDVLSEYGFDQVDFVLEPGQFSVRGGIVDVFSYSHDHPYRIEFFDDEVESIRSFDPTDQKSLKNHSRIQILPNIQDRHVVEKRHNILSYLPKSTVVWSENCQLIQDTIQAEYDKAASTFDELEGEVKHLKPEELFITGEDFSEFFGTLRNIIVDNHSKADTELEIAYNISPQPAFNKNFELMIAGLQENSQDMIRNFIVSDQSKQLDRIRAILDEGAENENLRDTFDYSTYSISLHQGFIDRDLRIACYTDHQIFERYHRFRIKERFTNKESLTLKEIYNLQPGDFVTHIDHGIGRFGGLEKIQNNGKEQEAIRLHYANGDLLYVSIHSLHRISKYSGKDGTEPKLHRLGGSKWKNLKEKTKRKVKDIAADLIALYAKRKSSKGFAFSADTYMQHELEASFFFEDTPDQYKATADIKADMEKAYPMDRLVCGDVGFGKTEVAIRAAFKAVADNKQVAVLVPTTILALQHAKTFRSRLKDMPCTVDYINRFKSRKEQTETLKKLKDGRIDILVGTHRLISKDVEFKDLGLLIIDEEQKFGVAVKEKLKQMKVNVDTLTLTATPIPRTLQFSLMGARDLSIINTPPPNRYPVQTELHTFNEEVIRDAINYEVARRGQVYIINNRIQNIGEIAALVERLVPKVRIAVGHGQMEGSKLERIMLDFIEGDYDVLIATSIIESGLDIPNANTIIIHDAQNFGLSDLHQLRGRVGRTNKKAFCYLITPPQSVLSQEARKRLKALEQFSDLGSGFNIAMRDLDIRGAGNLLGGEQSGFISDIGYEMYQKIMDEALQELKEEGVVHHKIEENQSFVLDCKIETDLEVLIPDDYMYNTTERLSFYKRLDACKKEEELQVLRQEMTDRFGELPQPTEELLDTLRMRWMAQDIGFEKIIIKNKRFIGWFVLQQDSPYYSSPLFGSIIQSLQAKPSLGSLSERKGKLSLSMGDVKNIHDAYKKIKGLHENIFHHEENE